MIYFGAGVILLLVLLILGRAFLTASPATILRFLFWFGVIGAVVVAGLLIESGRFFPVFLALVGLALVLRRSTWWRNWINVGLGRQAGQVSEVETDYLRMSLDRESGTMTGTVRKGPLQGRRLDELDQAALLALWREVRADDPPSVSLLENYLDRFMPDWRQAAGAEAGAGAEPGGHGGSAMTPDEAYAVLGLKPGATPEEIKEAHRRLMLKIHPDQGGSNVLAAEVNRAKDVLLGT